MYLYCSWHWVDSSSWGWGFYFNCLPIIFLHYMLESLAVTFISLSVILCLLLALCSPTADLCSLWLVHLLTFCPYPLCMSHRSPGKRYCMSPYISGGCPWGVQCNLSWETTGMRGPPVLEDPNIWQKELHFNTVEPVLKDHPIGHKNVVCQDQSLSLEVSGLKSLVTGSVIFKCRSFCWKCVVCQDR